MRFWVKADTVWELNSFLSAEYSKKFFLRSQMASANWTQQKIERPTAVKVEQPTQFSLCGRETGVEGPDGVSSPTDPAEAPETSKTPQGRGAGSRTNVGKLKPTPNDANFEFE